MTEVPWYCTWSELLLSDDVLLHPERSAALMHNIIATITARARALLRDLRVEKTCGIEDEFELKVARCRLMR